MIAERERGASGLIARYSYKPIFQYKFRPFAPDGGLPADGGFTVILYENGILSFSTYDAQGFFLDELCFSLPGRMLQYYYSLLRNAVSWLPSTPNDLRGGEKSLYGSSFAFDGYDPIRVFSMNALLCEPCGNPAGFFARHLYVLFEDICNLLTGYGITLSMDGFTWDADRIRPFRKSQLTASAPQRGVI